MSKAAEHKPCAECGNEFFRDKRNTWAYWHKAKFCSSTCAGIANARRVISKRPPMEIWFRQQHDLGPGCWLWNAAKDKDGYGVFTYGRKQYRAASFALMLDGRPVSRGQYACHHCDNPSCVRPSHLYAGTPKQNAADAKSRNRQNHGAKAKLTPDQVTAIRAASSSDEEVARQYGVSRSNVSMIKKRKTWRDLP